MTDLTTYLARLREIAGKAIPMAPGYAATVDGRIIATASNWRGYGSRELKQHPNASGYPSVRVMIEGRRRHISVHRLVANAFLPPKPSDEHEIRHLDGNKSNRHKDNLKWGTTAENAADRKLHGTERAAENGRNSAHKLRGRYRPLCKRGHDKGGKDYCNECRRLAHRLTDLARTR